MPTITRYGLNFSFSTKAAATEACRQAGIEKRLVDKIDVMARTGVCLGQNITYAVGIVDSVVVRLVGCTTFEGAREVQFPACVKKFIVTPDGRWWVPAGTEVKRCGA
jgi:hypothetical protein